MFYMAFMPSNLSKCTSFQKPNEKIENKKYNISIPLPNYSHITYSKHISLLFCNKLNTLASSIRALYILYACCCCCCCCRNVSKTQPNMKIVFVKRNIFWKTKNEIRKDLTKIWAINIEYGIILHENHGIYIYACMWCVWNVIWAKLYIVECQCMCYVILSWTFIYEPAKENMKHK